jgi:hypothetical protein
LGAIEDEIKYNPKELINNLDSYVFLLNIKKKDLSNTYTNTHTHNHTH